MRRISRIVSLAVFIAVLPVLAGCSDFDPDKLDVFGLSEKKKLPGERKPLFPEGVPGVTQGIPPEYMKGNEAASPDAALAPLPAEPASEAQKFVAADRKAEEKPKPKHTAKRTHAPKAKVASKPKPVAAAPTQPVAQQPQPQQLQMQPAPAPAPWPSAQPAQGLGTATPWPAAPPTGTFSRQ